MQNFLQFVSFSGDRRTFRVWLDCNQYREDMSEANKGKDDVYEGFNVIIRRKPKENNFKAVLETIRYDNKYMDIISENFN